jgi:ribonuclease Z
MNAENVLLTHFSARYPKMPQILGSFETVDHQGPTLGLAFDQARVRIGDMRKLELYLPAIEQSFIDTTEEGDEDADNSIARVLEVDIAEREP